MSSLISSAKLELFDLEKFDYMHLVDLYRNYFKNVIVVTPEHLFNIEFIKIFTDLSFEEFNILYLKMQEQGIANKSFSSLAMRLTMFRSKMLKLLGLQGLSLQSQHASERFKVLMNDNEGRRSLDPSKYQSISGKAMNIFKWRWLLQNGIHRIMPYRKYYLPETVQIPQKNYERCLTVLREERKNLNDLLLARDKIAKP